MTIIKERARSAVHLIHPLDVHVKQKS